MVSSYGGEWTVEIDPPTLEIGFEYKYCVYTPMGTLWENGPNHTMFIENPLCGCLYVRDFWMQQIPCNFQVDDAIVNAKKAECIENGIGQNGNGNKKHTNHCTIQFSINCTLPSSSFTHVGLIGSNKVLNYWDSSHALRLIKDKKQNHWFIYVDVPVDQIPFSYKYVMLGESGRKMFIGGMEKECVVEEEGSNRGLSAEEVFNVEYAALNDGDFRHPTFSVF